MRMSKRGTLVFMFLIGFVFLAKAEEAAPPAAQVEPASAEKKVEAPAQAPAAPQTTAPVKAAKKKVAKKTKKTPASAPTMAPQQTGAPATPAKAEEKKKSKETLQTWLKNLRKKINKTQSKPNKLIAVGAVRGDDKEDPTPLYWKGKAVDGAANEAELKAFNEALEPGLNGDAAGSKTKLEAFIAAFPQSPMVPDAQEALKKLAEE
ncbi:MAG: hypothetical protein LHV69_01255 [Elusimicrobia bacterium]|nr:hypothetical protein [Candidatus Obscuribacterium magneticum]